MPCLSCRSRDGGGCSTGFPDTPRTGDRQRGLKLGEGVTGWVAQHKTVVALARNAPADSRFKAFATLVEDTYQAFLSVPLVSGGEAIGVLNVHHREPHEHTSKEISVLLFVGEQMGSAIALSLLAEQNTRLQDELETRKLVERAKGLLQRRYEWTEQQAYQRLRNESRRLRKPIREIAEAILLVEGLGQIESQ